MVVNGTQQALDLISRVLLNPGDRVLMEEPHYTGARCAFMAQRIDPHWPSNVFYALLAHVLEVEFERATHLITHHSAHADPAGLGKRL